MAVNDARTLDADSLACPVCQGVDVAEFFRRRDQPTRCGYLAPTREQALHSPLADIALCNCHDCGHIWNSCFEPDLVGFEPEYNLSQFYSPTYRKYAADTVARLKQRFGLEGKTALEIACGKGDFLRMMLDNGIGRAIGFDPTFIDPGLSQAESDRLEIHRAYYDSTASALRPDLVVCRGCLQYIPAPREFLRSVRNALGSHLDTIVHFHTSNSSLAFDSKVVWYVMYEAGCFFTASSLARLFRECDFEVLDIRAALDGAHFDIESRPAQTPPKAHEVETRENVISTTRQTVDFARHYESRVQDWSTRFAQYRRENKRVAMWAAGMRAISLLSNCEEAADWVEVVADVNVERQGRYLPKTGQRVVSPEELASLKPDVIVCTNPTYADEIATQVHFLNLKAEFVVLH